MSKLYYFYGTMGSAKSAILLTRAFSLQSRGQKVILMKPGIDTREKESVIKSRIGISMQCHTFDTDYDFSDFTERYEIDGEACWVLIDEVQFITKQQAYQIASIVDNNPNINIMCYGLRTDWKRELFPGIQGLLAVADTIEEIKSTCSCGRKTIYNALLNNGDLGNTQVIIGGDDKYIALCRHCYDEYKYLNKIQ